MTSAVLVTGANGLLGAQCIAALANDPNQKVIGVWHRGVEHLLAEPPSNVMYVQRDLADTEAVRDLFTCEYIGAVLHTAVLLPDSLARYEERAVPANVLTMVNLASAARDAKCARFVYCSSVSVYGTTNTAGSLFYEENVPSPEDAYGWSKLAGEQYLRLCCSPTGMSGVSLRLSGLHGPGRRGGVFYHFMRAAISGAPITIASAHVPFQFLHLDDAVAIALRALYVLTDEVTDFTAMNVASAVVPSLQDIAAQAVSMLGANVPIIISGETPVRYQIMATNKLCKLPDWQPRDVIETLNSVFSWLENASVGAK